MSWRTPVTPVPSNISGRWPSARQPVRGCSSRLLTRRNTSSASCGWKTRTSSGQSIWTTPIRTVQIRLTRPNPSYPPELDRFTKLGLVPSIAVFNAVDLCWVILAARIGILRQPLNIKLFFSDRWVSHNDPDPDVLDFLVSRIPKWIDHEIVVVPYAMSSAERCQELWEHALGRGLGIRVGIGDCPSIFRTATNAQMVDRAVNLITKRGFTPATQDDVRTRFAAAQVDESELVRIIVNRNRCWGWGVCYSHAPEVYQPDSEGYCVVVKPHVDGSLLEKALEGAASCPERAIRVGL